MERKIGEIFEYNGEWYQCVESSGCALCAFNETDCNDIDTGSCEVNSRSDGKSVVFKKLEKVGEPYMLENKKFQKYKVFKTPYIYNKIDCSWQSFADPYYVSLEIKQNKEDMEEKKPTYEELLHYYHSTVGLWAIDRNPQEVSLDWICDNTFQLGIDEKDSNSESIGKNLKPFSLEAAKSGKPVCTRDGRKARIICFDVKGDICPIIALVEENDIEVTKSYDMNGRANYKNADNYDLMMLPEKKEGWAAIRRSDIYENEEQAKDALLHSHTAMMVRKITWEE